MQTQRRSVPFFVKRDLDGFFGLFIDNLVQLLVISEMTTQLAGLSREFVYTRILPGAAISVLVGNIFYSLQAWFVARREGRDDVTALPFGINTPSVIAFIIFIMAPIYRLKIGEGMDKEAAAHFAWQIGLLACLGSGLIEFLGAFIAEPIRRATPRAALIAALAGIAIGFISMDFILQVFEHPLLALVPMGIILTQYFSGARLPLGIPGGLAALLVGTGIGWLLKGLSVWGAFDGLPETIQHQLNLEVASLPNGDEFVRRFHWAMMKPIPAHLEIQEICKTIFSAEKWREYLPYLGVIVPMGLFNLVGSLQNIESAEAAGDKFATMPSLAVNGIATLGAAFLGSCFPTTIYIGHVGWKKLGARTGYSWLNGIAICAICLFGLVQAISAVVPIESVIGILLWIAIIISAQAFQSVPRKHAPAVALGLIPGIAAWGLMVFNNGVLSAQLASEQAPHSLALESVNKLVGQAHIGGLIALNQGFILSSMGLAAIGVMIIERRFKAAAIWAWILAVLSLLGIIHSWDPNDLGAAFSLGTGWRYAIGYAIWGLILFSLRGQTHIKGGADGEELSDLDLPEDTDVASQPRAAVPQIHDLPSGEAPAREPKPTIDFNPAVGTAVSEPSTTGDKSGSSGSNEY